MDLFEALPRIGAHRVTFPCFAFLCLMSVMTPLCLRGRGEPVRGVCSLDLSNSTGSYHRDAEGQRRCV